MASNDLKALFISWTPEWRTERLAQGFGTTALQPAPFASKWIWPVRYAAQGLATAYHVIRRRPDFVTFQNPPALTGLVLVLLSKVMRFQIWADCHSGPWLDPRWSRFAKLNTWVLNRCRGGLFHNPQLMAEFGNELPQTVLSWTPPLEDLKDAHRDPANQYVVMVCSYHADEPTEEVLSAARLLPDVQFRLTGKAPDEVKAGAPANVSFTGFLPTEDYWSLLRGASTVICLTKYPKTMQQGIAEALEAGVYGVSSDNDTMRDWRDGTDTCGLVDWSDPAAIAAGVQRGVSMNGDYDVEGRQRLLRRSHEHFRDFITAVEQARV